MRVILSRKGFDSQYGRMPSPILPDGTLLSMPIPSKVDDMKFTDLKWNGKSYYDIIHELKRNSKIQEKYHCHLDPDLRMGVIDRPDKWKPSLGQEGTSLRHLQKQGVEIGDLFLFFGWYKQAELIDGKLSYVKGAPDLHIIYGYLQIGSMITSPNDIPQWLSYHSHSKLDKWKQPNVIYIAAPSFTLYPELSGAGCLQYSEKLVLTKQGYSRRVWNLPDFFREITITYNADSWKEDCFVSAAKGQEFVFEANANAIEWIKDILK